MNFEYTKKSINLQEKLKNFMKQHIYVQTKQVFTPIISRQILIQFFFKTQTTIPKK